MIQPAALRPRRTRSHGRGPKPARPALALREARIEIPADLRLSGDDTYQSLQIHGRVFSAVPVEHITVRHRGTIASRTCCTATRSDAADRHGFACNLARPRKEAGEPWTFDIIVSTRSGQTERTEYVAIDGGLQATVVSGPTAAAIAADDPLPPAILHVERAQLDFSGTLLVQGWALALEPIAAVRVFKDTDALGSALLGLLRADVARWRPEYPNAAASGFELSLPIGADQPASVIRVEALTAGGLLHEICVPLARPPRAADLRRDIRLFCDEAVLSAQGRVDVVGWAVCPTGISGIIVSIDGNELGEAEFGLPRDDVGDEFITIPMARRSGFRFAATLPAAAPGQALTIVARSGLGDTRNLHVALRRARPVEPPPASSPMSSATAGLRLEIDGPAIVDGMVKEPVSDRLTIDGWALSRAGIAAIEVFLDGQRLGEAHYGLARQDVAHAFPDWPNAVRSGFSFHCPPRLLRNGEHQAEVRTSSDSGERVARSFRFEVHKTDDPREGAAIRRRMPRAELEFYTDALRRLEPRPAFHIVLLAPIALRRDYLATTMHSLQRQICHDWQLTIVTPDPDTAAAAAQLNSCLPENIAARVQIADSIAAWPNEAALIGLLLTGDELGCDALAEVALAHGLSPTADLFYADEARPSPVSGERESFFKPDFSPELLLTTNYIGRPWFATPALLNRVGATPGGLPAAGEYDLLLRCAEQARAVTHVPKLLCERGPVATDPAGLEHQALAAAAIRRNVVAEIVPGAVRGSWRTRYPLPKPARVSIIIPTCAAGGHVETCIRGLRQHTAWRNFEIICVENIPQRSSRWPAWLHDHADTVLTVNEPFNWSRFNNLAAAQATGDYLLFLNDDIEIDQPDWLETMLEQATRPEVGVVGPRLLYPDRTVQHAGMFLTGFATGRHAFRLAAEDDPGYFGLALLQRDVSAVTGACMLMRREHFITLGGFDEAHLIVNNDVDFCLRTAAAGLRVVFTPHATLIHHEQVSRGGLEDAYDHRRFAGRWRTHFAKGDPFHNPNLSKQHDDFRPNQEPVRAIYGGRQLFGVAEISRILVVKVDHIGDLITALPAIRQLKAHFPAASIHVLASPTLSGLAALETAIDSVIPFEFFHARSSLGQKSVTFTELDELCQRLQPYCFDLAIDLRKHPETRPLLRAAGAKYLAGFDHEGDFPWLDIALEWEGDRRLHPKRHHVTDDLLHLVDAVARAAAGGHHGLAADVVVSLQAASPLPARLESLFGRRVVCVHPGAGNEMKQWPAEHFVALIDLLVQESSVSVILIGGRDENEIAERILSALRDPQPVCSVVGELPLAELPVLLSRCALYVGNDSGPKHIAAAVGIPTIGIHSGVVDAREWGPMGAQAVALARQMSCSPCYYSQRSDCVRDLACIRQLDPGTVFSVCRQFLAASPD
ncbi:MAG TPA: glycosyltransferase family 9 protein [Acetobacteraceae bacterium]|nr:glycosyltransferase family 9 protein [Acetobacteraceae bacterium]